MAGLVPADLPGEWHGRLTVGGMEVASDPAARAGFGGRVGLLFQDPDRQLVMERAEDDVAFGLENRGWARDAMLRRVPDALDEAGLAGFERRRPSRLSGGEQQRLALAGVLAPLPGLLVLDEPTANLDPAGAAALMDRVAQLRESRRTTIVMIEHDVDRAWPMADNVLALGADGMPIDVGSPGDVLARSAPTLRATGIWLPGDRIRRRAAPAGLEPEEGPREVVVTADDVGFGFERDRAVLGDASVSIDAGERVALVGPNGSGKSTLGRLLVGLLRPSAGSIRLRGADPARMPAATLARRAGYAFQDPERQFLAATVADEVRLGLRPDERARADDLLASLGLPLERFADRSPYQLSGGEQRRLSLACILVRRPDLLVLDEPTFGQDRHGHEALLEILHDRVAEGTAVLAATHDRRFVDSFATRVLEMRGGRPVEIPT